MTEPCRASTEVHRRALLGLLVVLAGMPGCGEFRSHRKALERLADEGRYEEAAATLDEGRKRYRNDELLWHLDRGAVALAMDDDDATIEHLETAERMIDLKREASPDEVVATWLVGETAKPYVAEPYEDIYVNVLKLLAQLEAGRIIGGATVEARRLAWKSDHLRDLHQEWAGELSEASRKRIGSEARGAGRYTEHEGEFIESPLGTYLAAVAFMEAGEWNMQEVAARRLLDSIEREGALIGPVDASAFENLETMSSDDADLLVVALSGRGPTKVADHVGPIVIYTVPIYFELPRMVTHPSEVAGAALEVENVGEFELALVEDMSRVATENHKRYLPLIYTRTMLRAAAKATGTAVAAGAAHNSDNDLAAIGIVLGGLLLMAATEQADLRCWTFLPGEARVALIDAPAGVHRVRTVYRGAGGGTVHTTEWRDVEIRERGLSTLVEHYWR